MDRANLLLRILVPLTPVRGRHSVTLVTFYILAGFSTCFWQAISVQTDDLSCCSAAIRFADDQAGVRVECEMFTRIV